MTKTQAHPHSLQNPSEKPAFNTVVALDATPHSKTVVETLHLFCEPPQTTCDLLYVAPRYASPDRQFAALDDEAQQETVRIVNDLFDTYAHRLSERQFTVGQRHFVCDVDDVEEGLLKHLAGDDVSELLVLGMHDGQPKRQGWRIDSTSYAVATHTRHPVLVVKHPPRQGDRLNVLFASDGSEQSDKALERMLRFLPARTSTISLLTVVSVNTYVLPLVEAYIDYSALEAALTGHATDLLSSAKSKCESAGYTVANASFVLGDPVQQILEEAQKSQADLIVMGAHGQGGRMTEWLLGSVSSKVLEYSHASVAILR